VGSVPVCAAADVEVEKEKLGQMDVETLLAKIRQAQTPTQNMVIEWETEILPPFGIPAKRDYTAFISGNHARLECVHESYETRTDAEPYNITQRIHVFDGEQERSLERRIKPKYSVRPLVGRLEKVSYLKGNLRAEAFGSPYWLDIPELLKTFKMKLHDSNTPGIYWLDAIRANGARNRLTVDGNRGYHVVKVECFDHDRANNEKSSERNVVLKKRSDGLWYPVSREHVNFGRGQERVARKATIKNVKLNAEIPQETFNLAFPPGTAVRDDKLEEYVAISAPNTIDLLTLLAKIREAIRPAKTMRVHLTTSKMGTAPKVLRRTRSPVWQVKDFRVLISANRSRVDWTQRMYRNKTEETPLYIKKITSVFDGNEQRKLTEEVKNDRTDYSGTISEYYNNDSWLLPFIHATPSKMGNFPDYKLAAKGIDMKVTGSPKAGVYTLDALVHWYDVSKETHLRQRWRLTIDGNRGFNPISSVLYGDDDSILEQRNVTLREYAGGIWYPASTEWVKYSGDEIKSKTQIEIKAEFDVDVPEDAFNLDFPPGTKVRDL
jgi:outer membrane lipoprotein-sorting protein